MTSQLVASVIGFGVVGVVLLVMGCWIELRERRRKQGERRAEVLRQLYRAFPKDAA